jgi:hypothetical protein
MILFANNSLDAWTTLASSFSSQSSARYMQLRRQIDEVKKLDSSVTVYFNKIKSLSDTLTSIGQPLRPEELISCILNGLDEDFDALVEVVSARTTPIPLRDLFSQLLSTEQRIARRKSTLHGGHGDFSANASYRNGGGKPSPPFRPDYRSGPDPRNLPRPVYITKPAGQGYTSGGGSRPGQGDRGGDRADRGGDRGNYGGDRGFSSDRGARSGGGSGNRPVCQICDKPGHKASSCFKRFKQDYLGVDNDGRYMERQVAAATTPGQTSSYSVDSGWYMDTGATDHLTNHLDKLTVKENYNGTDQVHAANGHGMHIHHIGHSQIPTSSSHSLHLKGILHVPSVTRSLLSVRRFTIDNKVFIEFHPNFFLVKDRDTRAILLSGRCHGGLYRLDESSLKQVFSGIRVSRDKWHCRLGHPATPIV